MPEFPVLHQAARSFPKRYCGPLSAVRKCYVSNALKFNQNSSLLFTKTLQWKCLSTKTLIG